ncbi:hypothetical protein [Halopelagius fulvigenes]|uniref:50S ribosomal protein L6 n=1 Tax=Halopelagius fulvigenes TaxID=1198324 RepID=A0ABD5TXI1_9EURY
MARQPGVEVDIATDGLSVRIRPDEHSVHVLVAGIIRCVEVKQPPKVIIDGSYINEDSVEISPGEDVEVELVDQQKSVRFPARAKRGTGTYSGAFKSAEKEHPTQNFQNYREVKQILKRAEAKSR